MKREATRDELAAMLKEIYDNWPGTSPAPLDEVEHITKFFHEYLWPIQVLIDEGRL